MTVWAVSKKVYNTASQMFEKVLNVCISTTNYE